MQSLLTVYNLSDEGEENLLMYIFAIAHLWPHYVALNLERNEVFNFSRSPWAMCIAVSVLLSTVVEDYILMCVSLCMEDDWLCLSQIWTLHVGAWNSPAFDHGPSQISLHSAKQLHSDNVALTFMRVF